MISVLRVLKKPEVQLLVLYLVIVFTVLFYMGNATFRLYLGGGKCFLYEYTGLYCPACGGTRAVNALLHGDFLLALGYNLLILLLLPVFLYAGYLIIYMIVKKKSVNSLLIKPYLLWLFFMVIILYFLFRNIPHPLFSFLRP